MIVCIGWGSLTWDPGALPIQGDWQTNGPRLRIEFARQSSRGRLTLVLTPPVKPVPTLWAQLATLSVTDAREILREREGTASRYIASQLRQGPPGGSAAHRIVHAWLQDQKIEAAVWTALPPKWNRESHRMPTQEECVEFLRTRKGDEALAAEEYVRRTPIQICTTFRPRIEKELGWTPIGDVPHSRRGVR